MKQKQKKIPIEKKAEKAMREAVAEVIKEHIRMQLPLAIWENNRIVMVQPETLKHLQEK